MSTSYVTAGGLATPQRAPARPGVSRHWPALLFVVLSVAISLRVPQYNIEEAAAPVDYILLIMGAVLLPLARPLGLVEAVRGKAAWLIAFLLPSVVWHALRGDWTAVNQVGLLGLVYTWYSSKYFGLVREDIYRLYGLALIVGVGVWAATDLNGWGLIPGMSVYADSQWRVSFFPNIAFTAYLSLGVVLLMTMDGWRKPFRQPLFWIALYFLFLSFVRAVTLGFLIYVPLFYFLSRKQRSTAFLFWTALLIAIGVNLLVAYSAYIFIQLQDIPIISRLFLRGEAGLTEYEIYVQLYRPWLWGQHISQFWSSPWLLGWGSTEFETLITNDLVVGLEQGDTVSMPTRLLAQFGWPTVFFLVFLLASLWERARERDTWACAAFPVIALGLMQWGTFFHPTNGIGAILMLILLRGRRGFGSIRA
jgi:hypothetical protein